MNRNTIWRMGRCCLLVGLTWATAWGGDNLLLIVADDLGVDKVGVYGVGSDQAATPNIDALASAGVRFDNAWSNPVCSPTRAGLLSGRHGFRTGVGHVVTTTSDFYLSLDEWILPEALAQAGYATALIGKWHVGNDQNGGADGPNLAGFDHYAGLLTGALDDYFFWPRTVNGVTEMVSEYATTRQVDDALAWIDQQNTPWLCMLAFTAPHTPYHAPPENLHDVDLTGLDPNDTPLPFYKAAVEAMDTEIARLLEGLGDQLSHTTVIFIGDNGTPTEVVGAPFEADRAKGTVYEGGVRVPMIFNGPGVPEGVVLDGPAQTLDLFATLIEWAGLDLASDVILDAVSQAEYVKGLGESPRSRLYTEIFDEYRSLSNKAVRGVRFKLVRNGETYEFYDLAEDPFETSNLLPYTNLGALQQEAYERLRRYMATMTL